MKIVEIVQWHKEITELLYPQSAIKIHDPVKKFHVFDEIIRKDLIYLAKEGILKKLYRKATFIREKELAPVFQWASQFFRKE